MAPNWPPFLHRRNREIGIGGDVTNRVTDVTGEFFWFFISFVTFEITIKSETRMKNEKEI